MNRAGEQSAAREVCPEVCIDDTMSMLPGRLHAMKRPESWIRRTQLGPLEAIVLDNGLLRLTVVPELGGKIVSLVRIESGNEFLLQPPEPKRAYRPRSHGAKFDDYAP